MTCICEPSDPKERNGHSSSCNRYNRKLETDSRKAAQKKQATKKPIAKVGTKNTFECSDGERVTQKEIDTKLINAYAEARKEKQIIGRALSNATICEGCMEQVATCHAHIIGRSRCKKIRKTELIWSRDNFFFSCFECNSAIENPKGQEWKKLKNVEKCMKFIMTHDPELYVKFQLNAVLKQEQPTGEIDGLGEIFNRLATEPNNTI